MNPRVIRRAPPWGDFAAIWPFVVYLSVCLSYLRGERCGVPVPAWVANGLAWQAREVGLFFGLVGIVMVLTQGNLLGRMTDRFGTLRVLRGAAMCFSLSLALSSVASGLWAMSALGLLAFQQRRCACR
ncbi:MAG: hypothetical protein CM15mP74_36380 [Halieaceae bacterium]|nr:MAG: hypothetical protein CM15mP74_36380 [Halieaceae bacterium]